MLTHLLGFALVLAVSRAAETSFSTSTECYTYYTPLDAAGVPTSYKTSTIYKSTEIFPTTIATVSSITPLPVTVTSTSLTSSLTTVTSTSTTTSTTTRTWETTHTSQGIATRTTTTTVTSTVTSSSSQVPPQPEPTGRPRLIRYSLPGSEYDPSWSVLEEPDSLGINETSGALSGAFVVCVTYIFVFPRETITKTSYVTTTTLSPSTTMLTTTSSILITTRIDTTATTTAHTNTTIDMTRTSWTATTTITETKTVRTTVAPALVSSLGDDAPPPDPVNRCGPDGMANLYNGTPFKGVGLKLIEADWGHKSPYLCCLGMLGHHGIESAGWMWDPDRDVGHRCFIFEALYHSYSKWDLSLSEDGVGKVVFGNGYMGEAYRALSPRLLTIQG